jgi:hypothetical protein
MMTAITIKHIIRGDLVFVQTRLEQLHGITQEIERRMDRSPRAYRRGSLSQLQPTREKQIEALRGLCTKMRELMPRVTEFIGFPPADPSAEIDTLFALTNR